MKEEARYDGKYVLRTNNRTLPPDDVALAYKELWRVEQYQVESEPGKLLERRRCHLGLGVGPETTEPHPLGDGESVEGIGLGLVGVGLLETGHQGGVDLVDEVRVPSEAVQVEEEIPKMPPVDRRRFEPDPDFRRLLGFRGEADHLAHFAGSIKVVGDREGAAQLLALIIYEGDFAGV